jgi:NDP-sugar pyrophosphorylase family protein
MVLAAGLGTRMRPLTLLRAKPVLPVLNRPLLHWTLERLAHHGVTEVMINLHHRPASVRRVVGDGSAFGLRVSYSHERRILGTGGGPRRVRDFFGSQPFLLVNGDMVFDLDLSEIVKAHQRSGARATLALLPMPRLGRYGAVVTGTDGRVRSIANRPRPARGLRSLFAGVHVLDPALLERLPPGPSDTVRDLYWPMLAGGEPLHGLRLRGAWYDLSSPPLYLASQTALLKRKGGAERSLVHPTARVEPGALVRGSVIGPGCRVAEGARVEGSVLWERVSIGARARVTAAILADRVRVAADEAVRSQVVLGARRDRGLPRPRRGQHYVEVGK